MLKIAEIIDPCFSSNRIDHELLLILADKIQDETKDILISNAIRWIADNKKEPKWAPNKKLYYFLREDDPFLERIKINPVSMIPAEIGAFISRSKPEEVRGARVYYKSPLLAIIGLAEAIKGLLNKYLERK